MFESARTRGFTLFSLMVLALCFIYLTGIHFDLAQQGVSAWILVVLLWYLKKRKWSKTLQGKLFFLAVVSYLSLRYLIWRTFDTLVYITFLEFFFMALLFLAEIEVALVHFMGMFSNVWPVAKAERAPLPNEEKDYPDVDIFITAYNEPEELVEITATACMAIRYPKDKLHIHILDDGSTVQKRNDPESGSIAWNRYDHFTKYCKENNLNFITREKNLRAKAGNINNALTQTNSPFILFLDCDHVPTADFLEYTLGHFLENPKLFLVQTPHFFINPDPIEKNLHTFHDAPSENEMFFRGTHPGINLWNSSFFCGSAAIMRREALEQVNGFQGESITEDAETSLDLHSMGWESLFVKKPLVCGLSPDTFSDFIVQRSRWCQGMLQLGFLKNPLFKKGLTIPQRLCYSSFYLYWFFGFARVLFFVAPTLFLLFDLRVYHASTIQVAVYALPHLVASLIATDLLFGKYRWPFFSELYESVQSIFLLKPVFSVIANPHKPKFMVTPKGTHLDHDFLSPLATPFYIMFLVMLIAVPTAIYRWFTEPTLQDVIFLCSCWLTINIVIALASLGAFWERHQIRHFHRAWARGHIEFKIKGNEKTHHGLLTDLSLSGAGFNCASIYSYVRHQEIILLAQDSYGNHYEFPAKIRRISKNRKGFNFGCEFLKVKENYNNLIGYVYGDSKRWNDFWSRPSQHPNPLAILLFFTRMGASGAKQGIIGIVKLVVNQIKRLAQYLVPKSSTSSQ